MEQLVKTTMVPMELGLTQYTLEELLHQLDILTPSQEEDMEDLLEEEQEEDTLPVDMEQLEPVEDILGILLL